MNRDLRKGIYTRSRLQKKLKKYASRENETKLKQQRNKCVSLRKKAIRNHFKNATSNGLVSNQDFWNLVKPCLSNKGGGLHGTDITLVKEDKIITDDKELVKVFNDHYINIVEKSSGKKPSSIAEYALSSDDRFMVRLILQQYQNHRSALAIIQSVENPFNTFSLHEVSTDVLRLLRAMHDKKFTGEDKIPPKLVHLAARELSVPLAKAINISIRNSTFPERTKKLQSHLSTKVNRFEQ